MLEKMILQNNRNKRIFAKYRIYNFIKTSLILIAKYVKHYLESRSISPYLFSNTICHTKYV